MLEAAGLGDYIVELLGISAGPPDLDDWRRMVARIEAPKPAVSVALVGKYVAMPDAYISVAEALRHAAVHCGVDLHLEWVNAEEMTPERLEGVDGVVVPGGFGHRGSRARCSRPGSRATTRCPFSPLSGHAVRDHRHRARGAGHRGRQLHRVQRLHRHPVIDLLPSSVTSRTRAGPCAWASTPASCSRAPMPRPPTANRSCTSVIAIALSSTINTGSAWPNSASSTVGPHRMGAWSRSSSCATIRSSSDRSSTPSSARAGPAPPALPGLHGRGLPPGRRRRRGERRGGCRASAAPAPAADEILGAVRGVLSSRADPAMEAAES